MADKMEVDAVVGEKQAEGTGPAPEKPIERSMSSNSRHRLPRAFTNNPQQS